jgi:hypothetical protein
MRCYCCDNLVRRVWQLFPFLQLVSFAKIQSTPFLVFPSLIAFYLVDIFLSTFLLSMFFFRFICWEGVFANVESPSKLFCFCWPKSFATKPAVCLFYLTCFSFSLFSINFLDFSFSFSVVPFLQIISLKKKGSISRTDSLLFWLLRSGNSFSTVAEASSCRIVLFHFVVVVGNSFCLN